MRPLLTVLLLVTIPAGWTLAQAPIVTPDGLASDNLRDGATGSQADTTLVSTEDSSVDLANRVEALEQELRKQAEAAARKKSTEAQKPSFQIGGQLQVDYLWFSQDQANQDTVGNVPNAVDIRRARLVARGEAYDVLEYIVGFDFGLSGRPNLLDVWVGAHDLPYLGHLRAGHFFEPFSLERMTQNQRLTFMERSLADAFAPARNVGLEAYDAVGESQRATWAVGWFASGSNNYGEQFTDHGGQAVTARTTWLPFWDEASNGRSFVHLGAGYSYRTPPSGTFSIVSFPEARTGAPSSANVPPFVDTGNIAANHAQLFGAELAGVFGPLNVQGEYMATAIDQSGNGNLYFDGAYINVSYFLTGESRGYNKTFGTIERVVPYENFFRVRTVDETVTTGAGAWEIAFRYSTIDLNDANIQGGRLHDFTIGLNWYLNAYTRIKWELIQANLNRGPAGPSQAYIAGMRFDIDF